MSRAARTQAVLRHKCQPKAQPTPAHDPARPPSSTPTEEAMADVGSTIAAAGAKLYLHTECLVIRFGGGWERVRGRRLRRTGGSIEAAVCLERALTYSTTLWTGVLNKPLTHSTTYAKRT